MTFIISQSGLNLRKDTSLLSTMWGWIYQFWYPKAHTVATSYSHSSVVQLKNISAKMGSDDVLDGNIVKVG